MAKLPSESLTPAEAGRALGVSYPTVKQWIYRKRIRSVRTPGGHHRIPRSEIARLSASGALRSAEPGASPLDAISGRNKLAGVVKRIRVSGLLAEVAIDVGGQTLTSIITATAARELRLKPGSPAIALIKATEVMVIRA
ncbi:MAG TPA: TOBE domain-containing protein [Thermoanaerobaculia bacterium]|jgi:molybdopterin-binding protein